MKRALFIGAGTVVGAVAVLGYQPGALFASASPAGTLTTSATTTSSTAASGSSSSTAAAAPTTQTYTGSAVETGYGPVQVEITVSGSSITNVTATQVPQNDGRSAQINAYAIPQLEQQAMTAQSAQIDGVSGASYTSQGFAQSLQSALTKAGA